MKKILFNYLLISLFVFTGVVILNIEWSLAAETSILNNTNGYTSEDCKIGCGANEEECKQYCGDYGLDDFVVLGIKITNILLGLVGALAFGAFVYGGVMFLFFGVDKGNVQKGKDAMKNAVIGLAIVFSSYLIIQFTLETLGYLDKGKIKSTEYNKNNSGNWNIAPPTTPK